MAIQIGALTIWTQGIPDTPALTDEPSPADVVAAGWEVVGARGSVDYEEAGVSVSLGRTIERVFGAGSILPVLTYVSGSELSVRASVRDLTLDTFQRAFGLAAATMVNGAAVATDKIKGFDFAQIGAVSPVPKMLLMRGIVNGFGVTTAGEKSPSNTGDTGGPEDEGEFAIQYWFPSVIANITDSEIAYGRENPAALPLEFAVQAGASVYGGKVFGSYMAQHK